MSSPARPVHQRLFFALWPDTVTRKAVTRLANQAAKRCGGRRVAPKNLHLTLTFLGSVGAGQCACLEACAEQVAATSFDLVLDRLGYFARPRVLWLGAQATPSPLQTLVEQLRGGMAACGLEPEHRPFQPHLTLRRHALCAPAPIPDLSLSWHVDGFVLVRSVTDPDGAHYEVLHRWRF